MDDRTEISKEEQEEIDFEEQDEFDEDDEEYRRRSNCLKIKKEKEEKTRSRQSRKIQDFFARCLCSCTYSDIALSDDDADHS